MITFQGKLFENVVWVSLYQISESQSDSVKIGRDKGKFLKKTTPSPTPAASIEPPRTVVTQSNRGKSPAKGSKDAKPQKKGRLKII